MTPTRHSHSLRSPPPRHNRQSSFVNHQGDLVSGQPAHNLTASFPSGVHPGALGPRVPSFVPLTDLVPAFPGPTSNARRQAAQRWALALATRGQARKLAGRWDVSPDARLPDGLTVAAYLKTGRAEQLAGFKLPPGHRRWSDSDRQRFLNSHELLKLFDSCIGNEATRQRGNEISSGCGEVGDCSVRGYGYT